MLIVMDLEVLQCGASVGKIIGKPLTLGSDGTVGRNILIFQTGSVFTKQVVRKGSSEDEEMAGSLSPDR